MSTKTAPQIALVRALQLEKKITDKQLDRWCQEILGADGFDDLNRKQCSTLIGVWTEKSWVPPWWLQMADGQQLMPGLDI